MLTRLLISLHHILHKNRRIMPQTTTMSMTDRSASCTFHNIIPLNAITFIAPKIKYWDSELVYWKPQNIRQVSTWHQSALMNIWFLCNTSLTFLQNCQCTKLLCWKYITWKPKNFSLGISLTGKINHITEGYHHVLVLHTNHMPSNIQILVVHKMRHLSIAVCILDGTGHIITPFSQLNC